MTGAAIRAPRGLEKIIFGQTGISNVIPDRRMLLYRGYSVPELVDACSFEEIAYLLWNGELPTPTQLGRFGEEERELRALPGRVVDMLQGFPASAHPMDALRTGVSHLGMEDARAHERRPGDDERRSLSLLARIPTLIAYSYRLRKGLELIPPDRRLGFAANFYQMCFGKAPPDRIARMLDGSLILYAEHGFNASTFTARVVVSSLSDLYSGVVAGIGSLKGNLHGGANEQVMRMFLEIGSPAHVEEWLRETLQRGRKIMGFGHRLYRQGDSRVPTMSRFRDELAELVGDDRWVAISRALAQAMAERKGIHPNLDFPASPTYYMMGFDIDMFTPIFVMARISGWAAHIMEQLADNRLVRPEGEYVGPGERRVVPLAHRSEQPSMGS